MIIAVFEKSNEIQFPHIFGSYISDLDTANFGRAERARELNPILI
jgi:hypothetical protein